MDIQQRLQTYLGRTPRIDPGAYIAPGAVVIGDVSLGPDSSVWPTSVLRGDIQSIVVGAGSNVQDGAIVHLADEFPAIIGRNVTVGHGAIIHACTIGDNCLIGMRATVLDGAVIGENSIVGAHALVKKGMQVPPGSLVLGMPARVVRPLTEAEIEENRQSAEKYIQVARAHRAQDQVRR
jgi:carbonic anhydrase/acetyltransferase-like protein (isoleucine patch superfamily)